MSFNQAMRNQADETNLAGRFQKSLENPGAVKLVVMCENGKPVFQKVEKSAEETADDLVNLANAPVIAFAKAKQMIANREPQTISAKTMRRHFLSYLLPIHNNIDIMRNTG